MQQEFIARVMAVVSESPLRFTTSAASLVVTAASAASVEGSTAPGSYPAARTALSYSARTVRRHHRHQRVRLRHSSAITW